MVDKLEELKIEKKKCEDALKNFILKYTNYSNTIPVIINNKNPIQRQEIIDREIEKLFNMPLYD